VHAQVGIEGCLSSWKEVLTMVKVLPAIGSRKNLGVAKVFPRARFTALQYAIVIGISAGKILERNRLGYT